MSASCPISPSAAIARGIRNNNPLNIRRGSQWQGLAKSQPDKEFCTFEHIVWGYRAAIVLIRRYVDVYNLHTIYEIIHRWAPSSENNTASYIQFVQSKVTFSRIESSKEVSKICELIAAMQCHECGVTLGTDIVLYTHTRFF